MAFCQVSRSFQILPALVNNVTCTNVNLEFQQSEEIVPFLNTTAFDFL